MGRPRFPKATKLLITADAGGSNGHRVRLWKVELAKLAQETGLEITVCHYPPGTSKWNRIEHKHVQLHLDELAGTTPRLLPDHHRADLGDDHHEAGSRSEPKRISTTTRPAPRSATPSSPPCRSRATSSTATGTTRSLNQTLGEPLGGALDGQVRTFDVYQLNICSIGPTAALTEDRTSCP